MDQAQDKYRALLIEIKRRTKVVDAFLLQKTHAVYVPTTVESACLQIRKILELIAFGSLVANLDEFSKQHKKFSKYWNASLMLKDMERVNPDFYPNPIIQRKSEEAGVYMKWDDRPDDYLTKEKFVKVYEKCGAIMHSDNPFGSKVDYDYYQDSLPEWRTEVVNLLNAHTIKLVGDRNLYLFQMGAGESNPNYTPFAPVDTENT
ncbi:hypothetical protein J6I75_02870 [Pseudidiomarina sp. 1APP75-27a]|uniref:hypothetical protein n=1 Tax=Pseudidiomarina terrestris TaxID=2820060 RepID=UPI002B0612E9|nr:hypothetical protein [Pseudidiomarina sp. 1APP75-27a]MEA3587295.1 hypothetical protein [Pseudidiomarina sp. 1APP75-27a]